VPPAKAAPAHLRLIAPARKLGVHAPHHTLTLTDLGLSVGSLRAPLEIRVRRPRYSKPFRAAVVVPGSQRVIRRIPRKLVASGPASNSLVEPAGFRRRHLARPPFPRLKGFVHVSLRRHGRVAARGAIPFCPSGFRERINGRGPELSKFPAECSSYSPFVRGLVWGIDRGWASQLLDYGGPNPQMKVAKGRYRMTARISRPYRRLFDIPSRNARARMDLYVHGGFGNTAKRGAQAGTEAARPAPAPKLGHVPMRYRPDLIALPAWDVATDRQGVHDLLTFSATEWNAGPAPLDVEGFRREGHNRMRAYEYFHDHRGGVVGRAPAGHLEFDNRHGHKHWHFEQFARYSLIRGRSHKVAASHKQSFCIAPTDLVDLTVPGADWMTEPASLTTSCGSPTSLWVREAMPAGWGDTYTQSVAGQAFNITHVPNGLYRIRVEVNPRGLLTEVSRGNDAVMRRVRLGGSRGHRTVHAAPWRGIDP
jgi:lysyl oxidase